MTLDSINERVRKYLSEAGGCDGHGGWTIAAGPSTVAGRGVVATRDYGEGEVIFVDAPLIVSPRVVFPAAGAAAAVQCAVCHATAAAPIGCPAGCLLPVCGPRCADGPEHAAECRYVRRLRPRADRGGRPWSVGVYNALAPVRGLLQAFGRGPHAFFLDELQQRPSDRPAFEVEMLKKCVDAKLDEEDERIMAATCRIMDANCFETVANRGGPDDRDRGSSLKGLYPVAAFMNHGCVPNTMHNFDRGLRMVVKASLPIHAGQEITTTYTRSTWPTPLRRDHLLASKRFLCTCDRCRDPEEFGTRLAALNCVVERCDGRVLPLNPLDKTSIWQCKTCAKLVSDVEVSSCYKDVESLMNSTDCALCPNGLETVLKTFNIHRDSPYVVDFRLKFIWKSKNDGLNLEQLLYKERSCVEMLNIVEKLGLGQCRLLGLLSLELVKVIGEKINRFRWNAKTLNIFKEQTSRLNRIFLNVLGEDANVKYALNDPSAV